MHHSNWVRKHLLLKILQFSCFCLFERLPRRKSFVRIGQCHVCLKVLVQSANSSLFERLNRQLLNWAISGACVACHTPTSSGPVAVSCPPLGPWTWAYDCAGQGRPLQRRLRVSSACVGRATRLWCRLCVVQHHTSDDSLRARDHHHQASHFQPGDCGSPGFL